MRQIQWSRKAVFALIVLAALLPYANSLFNGFAYDDVPVIHDDGRVHGLSQLGAILLKPYWVSYGRELGLYRPLTTFGFAVQWVVSGGAPWFFHLVNVGLHAAVCVLLFLLLRRLVGQAGAVAGAVLFAVHPLHTEAVANVVGQAELLAALGVLAAALLWTGRPENEGPGAPAVLGLMAAYGLGILSKENAIVAPALLVALDVARRRVSWTRAGLVAYVRQVAPAMAGLALVALGCLALRYRVLDSLRGADVAPSIPFLARDHFWIALRVWPEYLRLLVFPRDLSSDYSPAVIVPVHGWTPLTLLGAALLLGTVALALLTPRRPALGLPAAWFVLSVVIISNLFFPVGVTLAERALYLPSAAVAFALAYAWVPLRRRYPTPLLATASVVIVAAFAFRCWTRNPDWRDQDAVVGAMVRDHPESYRGQWSTAVRAFANGDRATAARAWALTYRLWPEDSHMLNEFAAYNIAIGHPERAVALTDQARAIHPRDARTEELRADALLILGRAREALAAAELVRQSIGNVPAVDDIRARAFMGLGQFDSAAASWKRVVSAYHAGWLPWGGFGRSLARLGQFDAALAALDTARLRAGRDTAALRQVQGFRTLTVREAATARRP